MCPEVCAVPFCYTLYIASFPWSACQASSHCWHSKIRITATQSVVTQIPHDAAGIELGTAEYGAVTEPLNIHKRAHVHTCLLL